MKTMQIVSDDGYITCEILKSFVLKDRTICVCSANDETYNMYDYLTGIKLNKVDNLSIHVLTHLTILKLVLIPEEEWSDMFVGIPIVNNPKNQYK